MMDLQGLFSREFFAIFVNIETSSVSSVNVWRDFPELRPFNSSTEFSISSFITCAVPFLLYSLSVLACMAKSTSLEKGIFSSKYSPLFVKIVSAENKVNSGKAPLFLCII